MPVGRRASSMPRFKPTVGFRWRQTMGLFSISTTAGNGAARSASWVSTYRCCRPTRATRDRALILASVRRREGKRLDGLGIPRGGAAIPSQDRKEYVILPLARDAQILAGVAFLVKPGSREQRAAGDIGRQTGGLDTVQPEPLESKIDDEGQCRGHIALPGKRLTDPIAKAGGLRNPATEV